VVVEVGARMGGDGVQTNPKHIPTQTHAPHLFFSIGGGGGGGGGPYEQRY